MTQTFTYKARDRAGRLIVGKLQGDTANLVALKLRDQGYTPITVDGGSARAKKELRIPGFGRKVKAKEAAIFSRQFATMINAVMGAALDDTKAAVLEGEPLSKPLESHPVFPGMVVQMLAVGEETGAP